MCLINGQSSGWGGAAYQFQPPRQLNAFQNASCQGRCLLQIFEIFVLSCDLLVKLCPYNSSLGGAEDKARKQASNMSSFYIQKKAFVEGYLLIDFSVCLFDAYLISHSTASSHAVSRI